MGIQINGNTNNINAGIGSLSIEDINELDIVGVVTAANFKTGTTNVHSAGIEIAGINVLGANTPIGVGATIFNSGGAIFAGTSGVVTATAFHGSGANLTGIVGGATGVDFNDNVKARFGTGNDLEIYHNASHSIIHDNGTGDLKIIGDDVIIQANNDDTMAKFIEDGAIELYHDNEKMFSTNNDGAEFFDSDNNFNLYFNCNGTRRGYIFVDATNGGKMAFMDSQNHPMLEATKNGAVDLYYDNTKRLETTSAGVKVTGHLSFNSTGQGIDFGSSVHASGMANELLDDYEEGSWTPVFATAGSGGSTVSNPSNTQATYVKVGRIVYLHLGVHGLTKNWAGSNTPVYIRGIPYRSYFQHSGHPVRHGYWGGNDDDLNVYAQIGQYQTYMSLQKGGGAQGRYESLYWSDMHWEGYGNLTMEITYETDQGT